MSATILSLVVSIAALITACISALFTGVQAREAKRGRLLSAILPLYAAHKSDDFQEIRRKLRDRELPSDLEEGERLVLRDYINLLDHVAVLISHRLLDGRASREVFGDTMLRCASQARGFIEEEQGLAPGFAAALVVQAAKWEQPAAVSDQPRHWWNRKP